MKLTEEQYNQLVAKKKNSDTNFSNTIDINKKSKQSAEIDLIPLAKPKKKRVKVKGEHTKTQNYRDARTVIEAIQESKYTITYSDTHFAIIFEGAKLYSVNQIFSSLQRRPYDIFNYKKAWHDKILGILLELHNKKHSLPFFDSVVEVVLYRSAPKKIDKDSLATMFKYIIDAFKLDKLKNPYGLIPDDNPDIIVNIVMLAEKGTNSVGIKFRKTDPPPVIDGKSLLLNEKSCSKMSLVQE